jgi:hypothetical protein
MTEIEDKSLLICTLKKSADVLKKVVMYGSYVIVAIAIISAIAYLVWLGFNSPLIIVIYSSIISLLISIPWWAYSIVMAIVAIVGYSFLWCANRVFISEDWNDFNYAGIGAFGSLFLWIVFIVIIFLNQPQIVAVIGNLWVCILLLGSAAVVPIGWIIGAYLHYRGRIGKEQNP